MNSYRTGTCRRVPGTSKLWEPCSAGFFSVLSQERIPTLWLPLQVVNGPALASVCHAPWEGGLEDAQPAINLLLSGPGLGVHFSPGLARWRSEGAGLGGWRRKELPSASCCVIASPAGSPLVKG